MVMVNTISYYFHCIIYECRVNDLHAEFSHDFYTGCDIRFLGWFSNRSTFGFVII